MSCAPSLLVVMVDMKRPDRRVRYLMPSAIPNQVSARLLVIAVEWTVVVCLTLAVLSAGRAGAIHAQDLALVSGVSALPFALFAPVNEWIRRRWLQMGILDN